MDDDDSVAQPSESSDSDESDEDIDEYGDDDDAESKTNGGRGRLVDSWSAEPYALGWK